jgi:hypothetical protein
MRKITVDPPPGISVFKVMRRDMLKRIIFDRNVIVGLTWERICKLSPNFRFWPPWPGLVLDTDEQNNRGPPLGNPLFKVMRRDTLKRIIFDRNVIVGLTWERICKLSPNPEI